jgi:hypothetical protein
MDVLNANRFFVQGINMGTQFRDVINTGEETFLDFCRTGKFFPARHIFPEPARARDRQSLQPREKRNLTSPAGP